MQQAKKVANHRSRRIQKDKFKFGCCSNKQQVLPYWQTQLAEAGLHRKFIRQCHFKNLTDSWAWDQKEKWKKTTTCRHLPKLQTQKWKVQSSRAMSISWQTRCTNFPYACAERLSIWNSILYSYETVDKTLGSSTPDIYLWQINVIMMLLRIRLSLKSFYNNLFVFFFFCSFLSTSFSSSLPDSSWITLYKNQQFLCTFRQKWSQNISNSFQIWACQNLHV